MNLKPLRPLTGFLTLLLRINVAILGAAVLADLYSWYSYAHLPEEVDATETFLTTDFVSLAVGVIQILLAILLGVTFLRWIHRINKNLHALSGEPMVFTPGWSIGWYFVPIANLFKPYQAMKEIWTVAHRGTSAGESLLGGWWFLWIVSQILGRLAMRLSFRAEDAQGYVNSAIATAASDGLDIVLNIVALLLVRAIADAYGTNFEQAENAGPGLHLDR